MPQPRLFRRRETLRTLSSTHPSHEILREPCPAPSRLGPPTGGAVRLSHDAALPGAASSPCLRLPRGRRDSCRPPHAACWSPGGINRTPQE